MTDGPTRRQRAEAALTAYGLSLPETNLAPGWGTTRTLRSGHGRSRCSATGLMGRTSMSLIVKLPLSFDMVQDLPFVRPSTGLWRQHHWAIARFEPGDDPAAELDTLKGWLLQGWRAMAPKRLASTLTDALGEGL